jgi:cell pole-organizing protein PopZ
MAMQEPQAEPSMEEILASIRRIISEEDQPAGVLDLTPAAAAAVEEPEEDDIMVFEEPQAKGPMPAAAPAPVEPAPVAAPAPPPTRRAPEPPPARIAAEPESDVEAIISEPAAHVAADAFGRLANSVRIADTPGQSLEGMIRQLVKPMLKEWLDQNLPSIVEAKVEAELDRIARLSR